jgi:hypothetical protein
MYRGDPISSLIPGVDVASEPPIANITATSENTYSIPQKNDHIPAILSG